MNKSLGLMALLLLALPVLAHASCDAVKSGIDAKLKANGVAGYTLDVVTADKSASGGRVVGQCEGDKQILYARDPAAPAMSDEASSGSAKPGAKSAHVAAEPRRAGGCG